ncbi:MAG TPA: protein phosphatase 2C domain-containing protein [Solirubrobacteraceae bacterium]|nr:protein phosphatase 2C domain-containing protein [Solirubrobacteraceae bacterium]
MNIETGLTCPSCGAPQQAGDRFCEQCGARLDGEIPEQSDGRRIELDLIIAAAVSDQGHRHHRNEDSFRLEVSDERSVAVVICDGISSASAGNVAARNAAQAAGEVLAEAVAQPERNPETAILEAIQAANEAVVHVEWTTRTRRVDPSCTLVCALCRGPEVMVGWVGDSRAYWFDAEAPLQLTVDDSFGEEAVAQGVLTPEQAAKTPFLHTITNWVGPDAPARPPRVVSLRPERPGRLVLCTDGLWNYAPSAGELARLVEALPADAAPAAVARALTDIANDRGGHDNITVAVVDIDPSESAPADSPQP